MKDVSAAPVPPAADPLAATASVKEVFAWFESTTGKLEGAYRDLGFKFDRISRELEEKNRRLEKSYQDTERVGNQLAAVLESLDSAVVMVDGEEKITLFNHAAERIYGLPASAVLGLSYAEVFASLADGHLPLLETLRERKEASGHEKRWRIGGVSVPIGYTAKLVKGKEGNLLGAVEVSTDLTLLKQMQNQIQHARTLAALGEMAATVAHEIRNPLAGIGGFAGLLERDLEEGDPRRALVRRIVQGVSSLNKIVSNLLVYTKPMDLKPRRLDLVAWTEEILRYAEAEIEKDGKRIRIERRFQRESLFASIDPEKMQQVLLNLLLNAIQSIEGEGFLRVGLAMAPDGFLRVSVEDNGRGIGKESMGQIFNPFFTTKENGTGLGLAIARRILELHGGGIRVESEVGRGSRFEFTLDSGGADHG